MWPQEVFSDRWPRLICHAPPAGRARRRQEGVSCALPAPVRSAHKGLAHAQIARLGKGHTLRTTELVHESFLRLVGGNYTWDADDVTRTVRGAVEIEPAVFPTKPAVFETRIVTETIRILSWWANLARAASDIASGNFTVLC